MTIQPLSPALRATLATTLPDWHGVDGRDAITRRFLFADFAAAWRFMSAVAVLAEAQGHHPEWFNVWNRVDITLTTHDAGGLSEKDITLARAIDALCPLA